MHAGCVGYAAPLTYPGEGELADTALGPTLPGLGGMGLEKWRELQKRL